MIITGPLITETRKRLFVENYVLIICKDLVKAALVYDFTFQTRFIRIFFFSLKSSEWIRRACMVRSSRTVQDHNVSSSPAAANVFCVLGQDT